MDSGGYQLQLIPKSLHTLGIDFGLVAGIERGRLPFALTRGLLSPGGAVKLEPVTLNLQRGWTLAPAALERGGDAAEDPRPAAFEGLTGNGVPAKGLGTGGGPGRLRAIYVEVPTPLGLGQRGSRAPSASATRAPFPGRPASLSFPPRTSSPFPLASQDGTKCSEQSTHRKELPKNRPAPARNKNIRPRHVS